MKQRIQNLLSELGRNTYEREEVIALALLAALSGESLFILGLPGVGKSMIARRLKLVFKDARVFEYLMSRFSTPDEIFGPVSISKLKDEDCYERVTQGYLPDAEVIFLDEIWKAGPAIQNALLTVLNEKIFLNGNRELNLPVKAIIGASNELPAEDEGLEALWDRFLIRYIVEPLQSKQHFALLLQNTDSSAENQHIEPISDLDYAAIRHDADIVLLPDEVVNVIFEIRNELNKANSKEADEDTDNNNLYVSDRRWKKAVGVMRTSALLNDRKVVDFSDLLLLSHMLWNEDSQIHIVNSVIAEQVVKAIFAKVLSAKKSARRHAGVVDKSTEFYSPDALHYVIRCDDTTLKIAVKDYNRLLKSGDIVYASETLDERLVINKNGMMAVRVASPGKVCINSYNYPLITELDQEMNEQSMVQIGSDVENMLDNLSRLCNDNIFVRNSAIRTLVAEKAREYVDRLKAL